MKKVSIALIITTCCNLKCKYCINDSGEKLITPKSDDKEWKSADDIIACLKKISNVRTIDFIKFFGGEPLLQFPLLKQIVYRKDEFSKNIVKFAFTTNAYNPFTDEMISFFKNHHIILNISLDGPKELNNASRISRDKGDVYSNVLKNIEKVRKAQIPFALISVLDERLINFGYTIKDLCGFFSKYTPIYKIEPSYTITENNFKNIMPNNEKNLIRLLDCERNFINEVFESIFSLDEKSFIYENNVFRTISNIVYNAQKKYVCSAGSLIAIAPGNHAYSCYNLMNDKYRIAEDITKLSDAKLEKILEEKSNLLRIENFVDEYTAVQYYGDYCPKENNFESFAYMYRKNMIENIIDNLSRIEAGGPKHLALLAYIAKAQNELFFSNIVN